MSQPNNTLINITIEPLQLMAEFSADNNLSASAIFSPLSGLPWSIWLDSCDSDHIDSKFDILVWQPAMTLTTFGLTTKIVKNPLGDAHSATNETILETTLKTSNEDPLLLVEQSKNDFFSHYQLPNKGDENTINLPFIGGALGYFSYDLGRRFEKIPTQAQQDIHLPEMAVGIYNQAIVIDKTTKQVYLVCPDTQRSKIEQQLSALISQAQTTVALEKETVVKKEFSSPSPQQAFRLTKDWQSNINKAAYEKKFNQVQTFLSNGDCYQINLAQRFTASYQGDEFSAYQVLRKTNNAPFSAFMRFDDSAILSISPERFLSVNNGEVQSKPIKGTCPRHNNAELDKQNALNLQKSTKDRAENVMIVDLLRNDISRVCQAGSVKVPELFTIESFPAVHHLVSTVVGKLQPNKTATDLLRVSFPGGSITGAPKIRAMEIIESLEPHRRSVYCGSIGYISACGNMDTSITIRTLVCHDNKIHCWAGGGLVADSTLENEYQETFDKVQRILPVLSQL